MRKYLFETALIAALFVLAFNISLAHAADSGDVPEYVYGDKTGVLPDSVYGGEGSEQVYGNDNAGNLNMAITPRGTTIRMQPLEAEGNPYRGQYNDFDRSLYGSIDTQFTQGLLVQTIEAVGTTSDGNVVIQRNLYTDPVAGTTRVPVMVDENGFMVPTTSQRYLTPQYVQTASGEYIMSIAGSNTPPPMAAGTTSNKVAVMGMNATRPVTGFSYTKPMTQAQYDAFRAAQIQAAAGALPTIPAWIERLQPTEFALLPNGGAYVTGVNRASSTTITIYGPEGNVLGAAPTAADAARYFAKNYDKIEANAKARGWKVEMESGYIVLKSPADGTVQAVYDYDGSELKAGTELEERPYYFTPMRWDSLVEVARAQRRVPAAGRKPQAQQTVGTAHQTDNSPAPDSDINSGK